VPARVLHSPLSVLRPLLLAGVAAFALSGCATNSASTSAPDFTNQTLEQSQSTLATLSERYKANPRDKATMIYFAAALRAANQPEQAVSVLENGMAVYPGDIEIQIGYAKALAAAGRFDQAMNVINDAIDPANPNWNALLVKGAIFDQSGRNVDAREVYKQALLISPNSSALHANIGLSFAMSNDLVQAEAHLLRATQLAGATSQIRQNLALVICLQGRFDECRAMYAKDLPPEQVESNMAYVKSLLTQQNRWDLIKGAQG
jgi:Flp pilus assembly protein TadD